jgi:hypothetical protein
MIFDFFVFFVGILIGLYIDGIRQLTDCLVDWVNDVPKKTNEYEIKIEDYYDGRRDH